MISEFLNFKTGTNWGVRKILSDSPHWEQKQPEFFHFYLKLWLPFNALHKLPNFYIWFWLICIEMQWSSFGVKVVTWVISTKLGSSEGKYICGTDSSSLSKLPSLCPSWLPRLVSTWCQRFSRRPKLGEKQSKILARGKLHMLESGGALKP